MCYFNFLIRLWKLYLSINNLIILFVQSEESVNRPDEGELVKFTKDELNVPKEGRIYKRKTSSKQRVRCQFPLYTQHCIKFLIGIISNNLLY